MAESGRELPSSSPRSLTQKATLCPSCTPPKTCRLFNAHPAATVMPEVRRYAAKHAHDGHTLLLVAPGWVRTDMGGSDAFLSIEESIPLVVDMIDANRGKPGLRYLDRFNTTLPW